MFGDGNGAGDGHGAWGMGIGMVKKKMLSQNEDGADPGARLNELYESVENLG